MCDYLQVVEEQGGQPWVRLLLASAPAAAAVAPASRSQATDACQMQLSSAARCPDEAAAEGATASAASAFTQEQQLLGDEVSAAAHWTLCLHHSLQESYSSDQTCI